MGERSREGSRFSEPRTSDWALSPVGHVKAQMAEQQGEQVESSLCDQLQITVEELHTRLAFLSFGEQDGRNLAEILEVIASHVDEIIGEFYDHLLQFEELQRILSDPALVERLKGSLRRYLLSLGQLGDDIEYAEGRLRIGLTHERVGLKQKWYLGAYHKLFGSIMQRLAVRYSGDASRLSSLVLTLNKVLRLDEILVVETYYHATMQRLEDSLCQLKDAHRQLEGLSRQDPLTLVNNRRALTEALTMEFQRSRRYLHPFSLYFSTWTTSKRSMTGTGMYSAIMYCSMWCRRPGESSVRPISSAATGARSF